MTLNQQARWLGTLTGASIASYIMAVAALSQTPELQSPVLPPPAESIAAPEGEGQATAEPQVLEQGPVHEAFAEVIVVNPEPIVVDREPPTPVEELPPEFRPEGDNVEWIPGYWSWMDEKNDFVWVSGVWRSMPPNRIWVPGTWVEEGANYRWVPGYWSDASAHEVQYLPYPPETLEEGPSSPAPSDDHFWIPGNWTYQTNRYVWTPGYWYQGNANWVWVPNHYCYTPRGAIFVNGYWDYPFYNRGLVYAPVYWPGGYQYGYVYQYRPHSVLDTALLLGALYINRDRGGYYYGWGGWGSDRYVPWYTGYRYGNFYSPLFSYYNFRYGRSNRNWYRNFDRFDRHDWRDFAHHRYDWNRGDRDGDRRRRDRDDVGLIFSANDWRNYVAREGNGNRRYRDLDEDELRRTRERTNNWREFQRSRAEFEREGRSLDQQLAQGNRDRGDRGTREDAGRGGPRATFNLDEARGAQELRREYAQRRAGRDRNDVGRIEGNRGIEDFNRRDAQGRPIPGQGRDSDFVKRGPGAEDARNRQNRSGDPETQAQRQREMQERQLRSYRGDAPGQQGQRGPQAGGQRPDQQRQLQERQRNLEQQQRDLQQRLRQGQTDGRRAQERARQVPGQQQRSIEQQQRGQQQDLQRRAVEQQQRQQNLQQRDLRQRAVEQQRRSQQLQNRGPQVEQQRAYRGPDRGSLERGSQIRQQQQQPQRQIQQNQRSGQSLQRSQGPSRSEIRGPQGGNRSQSFSSGGGERRGGGDSGNRGRGRGRD